MHEGESRLFLPVIWITGFIRRARVVLVQSRQKKSCTRFYYGRTDQLDWDPNRFKWGNTIPFMAYAAAMGRGLLKKKHIVPEVVPSKWQGIIQANYRLKWLNVAVALNAWRGRVSNSIDQCSTVYMCGKRETVLHRFWECTSAQRAWKWGNHIMCTLRRTSTTRDNAFHCSSFHQHGNIVSLLIARRDGSKKSAGCGYY
uniref:Reverse transcriptase zinc-binding domain-containing protein n=1 Tax=Physcomitrium patens TaxID=3218 RepID=A0A2K1ISD7_PHYPA|nr:hypothetical protein PHYPA_026310 [Physcomitrium patens]